MITSLDVVVAAVVTAGLIALRMRRSAPPAAPLPKKPEFVPEAPEGSVPRPGSRRWARALYYNQLIGMDELNAFYASHPEDFSDPDR
jgi:hypothetical protein